MTSSALVPVHDENSSNRIRDILQTTRYSIFDHGQGYRTYSYEFDLNDYLPEQIVVNLDKNGRLCIRASRSVCQKFKREYFLGGPSVETHLVRNTIDPHGRLRVDVAVQPRQVETLKTQNNILTFDLQGYRPKNVNIRINETGLLKITAQHHDNSLGSHVDREYYRQYQLPKSIRPDEVHARMDENRILTIQLPNRFENGKQNLAANHGRSSTHSTSSCCCNVM